MRKRGEERRKKPEERLGLGRRVEKDEERGHHSEPVGIILKDACYGWLCQPVACNYDYTPVPVGRTHMAVSAGRIDGTEENTSNTCGLAVSAGCLQLSNTWLCQPVAQTWLCQPAVSMVNATYQHMWVGCFSRRHAICLTKVSTSAIL